MSKLAAKSQLLGTVGIIVAIASVVVNIRACQSSHDSAERARVTVSEPRLKVVNVVFDSLWFDTNELRLSHDSSAGDLAFMTLTAFGGYYARVTYANVGPGDCQILFTAWALDPAKDKLISYMLDSAVRGYSPSRLVSYRPITSTRPQGSHESRHRGRDVGTGRR